MGKEEEGNRYKLRAADGVSPERLVMMCRNTAQNCPSKTTHWGVGGIERFSIVMLTIPGVEH